MLHVSLITLALFGGILVEPFRVAEADSAHNQVMVRAAMASDGRFAVAWVDSVCYRDPFIPNEHELYVRFFDSGGNPVTEARQITKLADTNWIYWPCLAMDSAGSAVLLWVEAADDYDPDRCLRFQLFDKDGNLQGSAQTVVTGMLSVFWRGGDVGYNNQGKFAVSWSMGSDVGINAWTRRYSADGSPQGETYIVHDSLAGNNCEYSQVALSDAGDVVVTWLDGIETQERYPRFQAFDADDDPILPWEPSGHRVDDGGPYDGSLSQVHWLDNDRFVVFWIDLKPRWLEGRGFSDRGLTRHPIQNLVNESSDWISAWGYSGGFSSTFSPENRFALAYTRTYKSSIGSYDNQVGVLGKITNNNPVRTTDIFEYSAPLEDTIWRTPENFLFVPLQPPAVGACNDQIVWVYSRINTDSTCEAFAVLTDWDMSGIEERAVIKEPSNWEVVTSIGPQIVLRYMNHPDGFHVSVFDAAGRKVDELHAPLPLGTISWGQGYESGVYFIRDGSDSPKTHKVVLVR